MTNRNIPEQVARVGARAAKQGVKPPAQSVKQRETEARTPVPPGAIDLFNQRAPVQAAPYEDDEDDFSDDDDATPPGRLPSSSIKYQQVKGKAKALPPGEYIINGKRIVVEQPYVIPKRRSADVNPMSADQKNWRHSIPTHAEVRPRKGHHVHWILPIGFGMFLMIGLWQGLTAVSSWWTIHQQDATFGRPRTYQFDAVVGHNDSPANPTHFILINLNRKVEIYEEPGGDPAKTIIYPGPTLFGDGQDLTPILGRVADLLGNGKLDLIVYIQDQRLVYLNDGTKFVPATPSQTQHLRPIPPPPNT